LEQVRSHLGIAFRLGELLAIPRSRQTFSYMLLVHAGQHVGAMEVRDGRQQLVLRRASVGDVGPVRARGRANGNAGLLPAPTLGERRPLSRVAS